MAAFTAKPGQGSTEYLVLLAVVLIIALVSIALLGFFPGMSTDAKITQSASYWKSARPFAILDAKLPASADGTITMQNMDSSGTLSITSITIGNTTNSTFTSVSFGPGEIKTLTLNTSRGTAGAVYDWEVNITYTSAYGITNNKQFGEKNLVGKYV